MFYDIIGFLAIPFHLLALYEKNVNRMLIYGSISTFLIGFSTYGYGGFSGAFTSIVSLSSKMIFLYTPDSIRKNPQFKKSVGLGSLFSVLLFLVLFNTEDFWGFLPAMSLVVIVFADAQKEILPMKYWYLFCSFLWLIYGVHLFSPSLITYDLLGITILLYAIKRERKKINCIC